MFAPFRCARAYGLLHNKQFVFAYDTKTNQIGLKSPHLLILPESQTNKHFVTEFAIAIANTVK